MRLWERSGFFIQMIILLLPSSTLDGKVKRKKSLQIRETLDAVARRGLLLHRDRPQLLPPHRHPLGVARAHARPSQVNTRY